MKSKIGILIMTCAVIFSTSITTYAKDNVLSFGEPYMDAEKDYSVSSSATIVPEDVPSPLIDSDGTFSVDINNVGYILTSDKFKISDTSCTIRLDAGAGSSSGSEYFVTLYKDGIKVKKVSFYTGGIYQYTFNDLSTSAKYYMKIDSNNTTLHCYGTISNYVHIN